MDMGPCPNARQINRDLVVAVFKWPQLLAGQQLAWQRGSVVVFVGFAAEFGVIA